MVAPHVPAGGRFRHAAVRFQGLCGRTPRVAQADRRTSIPGAIFEVEFLMTMPGGHLKDQELSHREILMAYLIAIGSTLASISCRDCRELAAKSVTTELPHVISAALDQPGTDHVH
jgi:hypothetical protein